MDKLGPVFKLVGIGFFIGGSIVLGVFGGLWLDSKLGTRPLWAIVGLIVGLFFATYGVYQMLLPIIRDEGDKGKD